MSTMQERKPRRRLGPDGSLPGQLPLPEIKLPAPRSPKAPRRKSTDHHEADDKKVLEVVEACQIRGSAPRREDLANAVPGIAASRIDAAVSRLLKSGELTQADEIEERFGMRFPRRALTVVRR